MEKASKFYLKVKKKKKKNRVDASLIKQLASFHNQLNNLQDIHMEERNIKEIQGASTRISPTALHI